MLNLTHRFSLGELTPQKKYPFGFRVDANKDSFPLLKGMALSYLQLSPKGVREPHWHPNANELSYCLAGEGLMTIFSPGGGHDTFTIRPGEIIFVPQNYLHHIENTGSTNLQMLICFNHESPEDLNLSSAVASMPLHILAATFSIDPNFFKDLKRSLQGVFISQTSETTKPPLPFMTNRFKMDIENSNPEINVKGGSVKMSNKFLLPTLEGLSMYEVVLTPKGAREPHWHPNAAELNYLIEGTVRITLLSPNGKQDTFDMKPGDMSFLPEGYLHHIENTGTEDAKMAIFFNNVSPSDLGLSGAMGAYSNGVLASLFGVSSSYFDQFPKFQQDLFVIGGG